MTESDVLRRVRALLDKAAATTFEAERDAFTAKAQELMIRHAIDEAMLAKDPRAAHEKPISRRIAYTEGKGYHQAKKDILAAVTHNNRCKLVYHTKSQYAADKTQYATIVGFADDIAWCEMLYTSLWMQCLTAAIKAHEQAPEEFDERSWEYRKPHRKTFVSAFAEGFVYQVNKRMREANQQATKTADADYSTSTELVLLDRKQEVTALYEEMFPNLTSGTRSTNRGNAAAWSAGNSAGSRANLGQPAMTNSRPALPNH